MTGKNDDKEVKGICKMCLKGCGIDAHVKDGKLLRVTGDESELTERG